MERELQELRLGFGAPAADLSRTEPTLVLRVPSLERVGNQCLRAGGR
jgi:hypothetical protein